MNASLRCTAVLVTGFAALFAPFPANAQSGRVGGVWIRVAVLGPEMAVVPVPLFALQLLSATDTAIRFGVRTSAGGTAAVEAPAGRYRLVSPVPAIISDKRYRWSVPIDVAEGINTAIELTDANASVDIVNAARLTTTQTSRWDPTRRGVVRIAGGASLSSSDWDTLLYSVYSRRSRGKHASIDGSLDYFVVSRLAFGLTFGFARGSATRSVGAVTSPDRGSSDTRDGELRIGPQVTFFPFVGRGKTLPYVRLQAIFHRASNDISNLDPPGSSSWSRRETMERAAVGTIYMFSQQVGLDVSLEYTRMQVSETGTWFVTDINQQPFRYDWSDRHDQAQIALRLGLAAFVKLH